MLRNRIGTCNKDKLLIDSGASEYIAHKNEFFLSLESTSPISVQIADGRELICTQTGAVAVQLVAEDGKNAGCVVLRSVYFLPDLEISVISVRQLVNSGITVSFSKQEQSLLIMKTRISA